VPVAKLEEKWWGCKTTSSRCPWVLNVEIRGCLHGENKSIISKILIFVGAFAPTIYNVASPVPGAHRSGRSAPPRACGAWTGLALTTRNTTIGCALSEYVLREPHLK
jgi:hypothetical protein